MAPPLGPAAEVSKLTTTLQNVENVRARTQLLARNARQYCDEHNISMQLSSKVRQYVEWKARLGGHVGVLASSAGRLLSQLGCLTSGTCGLDQMLATLPWRRLRHN